MSDTKTETKNRKLQQGQGALFVMRHFPEARYGGLLSESVKKMSAQINEYWNDIGLGRPDIAICTTAERSQQTAKALGFTDENIAIIYPEGRPEIKHDLSSLFSWLAQANNELKPRSAVFVGHQPQMATLWKSLNEHKAVPVPEGAERTTSMLAGVDMCEKLEKAHAKFGRYSKQFNKVENEDSVANATNTTVTVPSVWSGENGAMFWAAHDKPTLREACDTKSFADGETFSPGFSFNNLNTYKSELRIQRLGEKLAYDILPNMGIDRQHLKKVEREPALRIA